MFLAGVIAADEDMLICDLAETYGILQYRSHPARLIATLTAGLRDDSRVKMRLTGTKAPLDTLLLAAAADRLTWLSWAQTEQARSGTGQPNSVLETLLGKTGGTDSPVLAFDTGDDFEAARAKILSGMEDTYGN